ncbi:MAG: prepilin-type N-terminal cleavage/methylation domain-containing protein [Candidatus Pacebacteria bacterium]|nr:prepilin-type N-terminal cleavage/methylation domain-containing protein [Candidatus Paceibacterota bacterium]
MITNRQQKKRGFTVTETIVTIGIFTILMLGITQLFVTIFTLPKRELNSSNNLDQARLALVTFANEVRNATTGNNGAYVVNQAGDSQIIFYSNYGATGGAVKRIRYFVSGNTLSKGVITPTGTPLTYGAEVVTTVQNNLANGGVPVFYYYDDNYNGAGASLTQPVNVNSVKYIKMNLIILKQLTPTDTTTTTVDMGVALRTIKTNLGN